MDNLKKIEQENKSLKKRIQKLKKENTELKDTIEKIITSDDCWDYDEEIKLSDSAKQCIIDAHNDNESDLIMTIKFFTKCCKHCQMMDLSCSADMNCICHLEQVDKIKEQIPEWIGGMMKK